MTKDDWKPEEHDELKTSIADTASHLDDLRYVLHSVLPEMRYLGFKITTKNTELDIPVGAYLWTSCVETLSDTLSKEYGEKQTHLAQLRVLEEKLSAAIEEESV